MFELNNVVLRRGGKEILREVNLGIGFSERVVLTGPNGSGKTHLGLLLSGMIYPTEGTVIVDGKNIKDYELKDMRRISGIVFQEPEMQFITMSVEKEILFGLQNIGLNYDEMKLRSEKIKSMFGLDNLWYKSPYQISGGEKQIVAIASIVAMEPSFIIFDEITTFLDRKHRERIYEILKQLRCGYLWITQDFDEIPIGERLLVLEDGRIVFDGGVEPLLKSLEIDSPLNRLKRLLIDEGLEEFL